MRSRDDRPSPAQQPVPILLTLLAAVVLVALLAWLGLSRRDQVRALFAPAAASPTETAPGPAEPWPTLPPTFTPGAARGPIALRTAVPTATPTPPPTSTPVVPPAVSQIEKILELNVIQYKGTTVIEKETKSSWWRRDWVMLMAVGRVRVGLDLKAVPAQVESSGSRITVTLPHAKVTSVELLPEESRIVDSHQAWIFSQYPGLEDAAYEAAKVALEEAGKKETAILEAADTVAKARIADLCRGLGFTEVDVQLAE